MKETFSSPEIPLKSLGSGADEASYRFAGYELDCAQWQLRWQGESLPVYRKSFDLLLCLVRAHPRVVTKDELLEAVWPGQFVEENNLAQQVSLLRKILTRHTDAVRLIETVPGRGYRFGAPVEVTRPHAPHLVLSSEESITRITVQEETEETVPVDDTVDSASPLAASPATQALALAAPPRRRWLWTAVGLTSAAALAVAGWFGYQWRQNHDGGPPVQVVLTPLEGSTGDTTLDHALNDALRFDLAESPFVTLVSQSEVATTLHQMRRTPNEALTTATAREVCERTSSQAVLHAVLAHTGQHFLLTGEAVSCVNGSTLASTEQDADRAEDLPLALGKLTATLRRGLGEARRSVARFRTPALTFQTASLDALKANYQASLLQHAGKFSEALEGEKKAVALDPNFAFGYYDLAVAQSSLHADEDARASMQRAYDLRGTVDPQSAAVIAEGYDQVVTGDLYAAERTAQLWVEEYPRSTLAWNELSRARMALGNYAGSIGPEQKAAALRPDIALVWSTLAQEQLHAGDLPAARAFAERGLSVSPNLEGARMSLARVALHQHDAALFDQQLTWSAAHPESAGLEIAEAELAVARGQFAESMRFTDQSALAFHQQGNEAGARQMRRLNAMELLVAGDRNDGERRFRELEPDPEDPSDLVSLALLGKSREAETLLTQTLQKHPHGTVWQSYNAPVIRGVDLLTQGHPDQALAALNQPGVLDTIDAEVNYLRGTAYLALHDAPSASRAFHRAVDHPGLDNTWAYSLSLLGLARAEAEQGHSSESAAAYQAYRQLMQHADTPVPAVLAAAPQPMAQPLPVASLVRTAH